MDNIHRVNFALLWRHNGRDGVSNHQAHDCLLNHSFRSRSTKTSKLRVTGLCAGNSPATGEFPAQMASNAENVSIWWRHHGICKVNTTAADGQFERNSKSLDKYFSKHFTDEFSISCWTNSRMAGDLRLHDVHVTSSQWAIDVYMHRHALNTTSVGHDSRLTLLTTMST